MPFNIYTAIDILDRKAVRLYKGDYNESQVYNDDPVALAKEWQELGAKFLHIVDLDGAKEARSANFDLISEIIQAVDIPVQVGGGIRTIETMEKFFELGANRLILGSLVIKEPETARVALKKFGGDKIVFGLDTKGGYIATEGWLEKSESKIIDVIKQFEDDGLKLVAFTDIDRDGTMTGPSMDSLVELLKETDISIIASGGVSKLEDVNELKALQAGNLDGVIIGKALYTGAIDPRELYTEAVYN